jgi:hypothetical protein
MFATRILPQQSYHSSISLQYERQINDNPATVYGVYIRALAELSTVQSRITAVGVVWLTPVPWRTPTTREPQLTLQHLHYTEPLSVLTGAAERHRHLTALSVSAVQRRATRTAIESKQRRPRINKVKTRIGSMAVFGTPGGPSKIHIHLDLI